MAYVESQQRLEAETAARAAAGNAASAAATADDEMGVSQTPMKSGMFNPGPGADMAFEISEVKRHFELLDQDFDAERRKRWQLLEEFDRLREKTDRVAGLCKIFLQNADEAEAKNDGCVIIISKRPHCWSRTSWI